MALATSDLLDRLVSTLATLGVFGRINRHEPKNAPGRGLNAALFVQSIAPSESGLARTSVKVVFTLRIFQSMATTGGPEAQDMIDPKIMDAVDQVCTALSGDFDLGGTVRYIDLLGHTGPPLSAQAGYLDQDGKIFRIMDVTIPIVINDVWVQA